jgi:PKD repeat protein
VDEVAVYPATLSAAQVAGHWTASGRSAPQPVAQANLTATPTGLTVNVDGSGSLPGVPTGSITSYSWNWGDGTPAGSGVTTSHAYAAGGTYTITLTVIDDGGRTATATQPVTVANPTNAAPTAAFTPTTNQRTVSVDGSASADPDGSISSYSWNWGDKTPAGTGPTATHTYGGDGTYTITLTVTDNDGATGVVTHQVTASLPQTTAFVDDIFDRTTTTGWGTATLGGPWTVTGSAKNLSVSPGTGTSKQAAAGSLNRVSLNNVSVTSADVTTAFSLDQIPTGGGAIVAVQGRAAAGQEYQVRIRFLNTGQIKVAITRHDSVANGEWLIGSEVALPTPYTAGTPLNVRLQVYGTSPTTLKAKVWTGATEPTAWTVSQSDSTAALQVPGSVGLSTYLSGSATVFPVTLSFTRYTARPVA